MPYARVSVALVHLLQSLWADDRHDSHIIADRRYASVVLLPGDAPCRPTHEDGRDSAAAAAVTLLRRLFGQWATRA